MEAGESFGNRVEDRETFHGRRTTDACGESLRQAAQGGNQMLQPPGLPRPPSAKVAALNRAVTARDCIGARNGGIKVK